VTHETLSGFVLFPTADIIIPEERQRKAAEPDDSLIASIESRGLLNPIIIHGNGELVAGERRLRAHMKMKRTHIPARIFEGLSHIEKFEVELQENLARKQLTWQEEVRAIGQYHEMKLHLNSQNGGSWTQMGTSTALGISQGHLSMILAVARDISDESVATCPTLKGAFNLISARADRARIAAQSRGIGVAETTAALIPALPVGATKEERTAALMAGIKNVNMAAETVDDLDKNIKAIEQGRVAAAALEAQRKLEIVGDLVVHADFLEWAETYEGPKFDVLHVDFPYGKGYSGARTRRTGKEHICPVYNDNPDIYLGLVEGFLALQDRIAFPAAHCLFWFDMSYYQWTIDQFEAAGWTLTQPFPFIWAKGYQGIASDVKRRPRHVYETCLLFSRGDRKIVKLDKGVIDVPVDEKLHLNQKPIAMLKHLLGMYVDDHTAVLDPTCGSGSAIAAARLLGAARVLGVELDSNNADVARLILQRTVPTESKVDANDS